MPLDICENIKYCSQKIKAESICLWRKTASFVTAIFSRQSSHTLCMAGWKSMCPQWFCCGCSTWYGRGLALSAEVFSHGYKVLQSQHWSQAQHSFTPHDSQAKSDSQARWWQLGQGIIFSCKTSNFEHVIVANNPKSFLFNESIYRWQHQRHGVKGGWVKPGTDPLQASIGWENQTWEREDCINTYINNRVKEVFIFSNRPWEKDFYPLFLFSW